MLFGLPYYLILVIPLAGSLFVPVVGRFSEKLRDWTPAILMGIAMVLCWSLLGDLGTTEMPHYEWINIPGLNVPFEMLLDPLSIIMSILASTLCFLIYVYSTEYMAHEGDRNRFFFLMLAFGGGMLTLVLSNNLLIAFIGWEIMGFCSYGLIGFWNDKKNPPEVDPKAFDQTNPLLNFETEGEYNTMCGTKAFIVTRIGDAFMLAGILLLFTFSQTFLFTDLASSNGWWNDMAGMGLLLPALVLIFAGAIGKSGQAPLQVWLPEAMAGPTAVSALIHAATMVKAGVYVTARFLITIVSATATTPTETPHGATGFVPLATFGIESAITFFIIVAVVGAITAFMTATMGMVSNELKQVLAFSTLSQLGYMILAVGTSGILALDGEFNEPFLSGLLHVVSHGAFKALLFLSAGGVIHAVHTKYMSKMGGLKGYMKWTYRVMVIGVLALAGIPPMSGFWSKDSIIEFTYELATHSAIGVFLFVLAVAAAGCTIFYSIRLIGMVFHGPLPEPEHHDDDEHHSLPHDPGKAMMIPLYILAAFTVIAFLIYPLIEQILITDIEHMSTWGEILGRMIFVKISWPGIIPFGITIIALLLGGVPAYIMYIKNADTPNTSIPEKGIRRKIYNFLFHRWYINESYYWFVNKFLNFADNWRRTVDEPIIDGIDFKSASSAIAISTRVRAFDDNVVDGFAEGISTSAVDASQTGLKSQTGRINDYVGVVIFGFGLLIIIALLTMGVI
jgi:NADH-quinone oxidoreductase subunit L